MIEQPCPFCGQSDLDVQQSTPDREGTPVCIICAGCGATGPWQYRKSGKESMTRMLAIHLWNTRKHLDPMDPMD